MVIVSASDSFLARSLVGKLENAGIETAFSHADIKEIEGVSDGAGVFVLFVNEEFFDMPEVLVYMKDIVEDKNLGLILIGDQELY